MQLSFLLFEKRIITLELNPFLTDQCKSNIQELKKDLLSLLEGTSWRLSQDWLLMLNDVLIDKIIEDLRMIIEFLNNHNISWKGGTMEVRDSTYRIGFLKITKTIAIVSLMDEDGLIEKQEFELPVKKEKL